MYRYLIHSTSWNIPKLRSIKKDQLLKPLPLSEQEEHYSHPIAPYVYSFYLFSDLDYHPRYKANLTYGLSDLTFIIDPSILKDRPFFVCNSTSYGSCVYDTESLIIKGKGSLSRMPSLQTLEQHINNRMRKERQNKQYNGVQDFIMSHEVLIDKVPLKYVKAILVNDKNKERRMIRLKALQEAFPNQLILAMKLDVPLYKKKLEKLSTLI